MIELRLTQEQATALLNCLNEARKGGDLANARNAIALVDILLAAAKEAEKPASVSNGHAVDVAAPALN